ncbi:hypothetical protein IV203_009598 [Nitzschia inconspicua]|uniref:Uncharacterized protein n=1 Tax=Nitzschia inconspicua TaxID=303405 RepID=A0A9K3KW69_9STRA|nr:hypothetical protein IV203_009598 [Nitzschia inconspicua]
MVAVKAKKSLSLADCLYLRILTFRAQHIEDCTSNEKVLHHNNNDDDDDDDDDKAINNKSFVKTFRVASPYVASVWANGLRPGQRTTDVRKISLTDHQRSVLPHRLRCTFPDYVSNFVMDDDLATTNHRFSHIAVPKRLQKLRFWDHQRSLIPHRLRCTVQAPASNFVTSKTTIDDDLAYDTNHLFFRIAVRNSVNTTL